MTRTPGTRSHDGVVATATVLLFVLLTPLSAYAVQVERIIWGFDGTAVAGRFNPLSVLVSNESNRPFEGVLRLRKQLGGGQVAGAIIQEPVFVAPFGKRWVQFYPFVVNEWEAWELSLGRGFQKYGVGEPTLGLPAHVLIEDPDSLTRRGGAIKRFSEALFPTSVTGTDALASVVLDHAPRWQQARRRALAEWIYRGGKVHLIRGPDGNYPTFTAELSALNAPLESQNIGDGSVVRHDIDRQGLTKQFVEREVNPPPPDPVELENDDTTYSDNNYGYIDEDETWELMDNTLRSLKAMTRPDHDWSLIHIVSLGYILLATLGCYLVAKRKRKYGWALASLGVVVVLATWLFATIGKRGYDESTTVNSVALLTPLGDEAYDVAQWSNAFVTDGDVRDIRHQGPDSLYTTTQSAEAVRGWIDDGAGGVFRVDIPPYSSRSFFHRRRSELAPFEVEVKRWEDNGARLMDLRLEFGDGFPKNPRRVYALFRDDAYEMRMRSGGFEIRPGEQTLADRIASDGGAAPYH
ncbi:MAG: hypothetical protein MI757_08495, partial [Pirellulales bacterium]|nr:hypothetical protein [Pirellulales bacterium]